MRPLLVEHLDDARGAYYLVPWNSSHGIELIVRLNASNGEFLGLSELAEPHMSVFLSADDAEQQARASLPGFDFGRPRCVWRPCRQSTTPYRPFFELPYEGGKVYVDMDGVVHERLTPLGRGGAGT